MLRTYPYGRVGPPVDFKLFEGVNAIGRGNDSSGIVLPSSKVSKNHAQVHLTADGGASLVDLDSTNATRIGGLNSPTLLKAHTPRRIRHGDTVTFGDVESQFLLKSEMKKGPQSSSSKSSPPYTTVFRRETFSASHRLHVQSLSDAKNKELFGACNNPNGHGHNYAIVVSVRGPVDPTTGMVMNISDLKGIIKDTVLDVVDHKNLDKDVPYFKNRPSTSENVAVFCWEALAKSVPPGLLHEVRIEETEKNFVSFHGKYEEDAL